MSLAERYDLEETDWPDDFSWPPNEEHASKYAYMRFKAFMFRELGPANYAAQDAHGMPSKDWPDELLETAMRLCEQLMAWKGTTLETALKSPDVESMHMFASLFHFKIETVSTLKVASGLIDQLDLVHFVTGERAQLFMRIEDRQNF